MVHLDKVLKQLGEWGRTPTDATFEPPRRVPALRESCERIVYLSRTTEFDELEPAVKLYWTRRVGSISTHVEEASDARRKFLHPLAQPDFRVKLMTVVEFGIDEAYKIADKLQRDMEVEIMAAKRGKKIRPEWTPQQHCSRAYQRAAKFVGLDSQWSRGEKARNARGFRCGWASDQAEAFSVVGAVRAATRPLDVDVQRSAITFISTLVSANSEDDLQAWNDRLGRRHADVLQLLDEAAEAVLKSPLRWQTAFELERDVDDE